LLRGIAAFYKPSDSSIHSLQNAIRRRILDDLNELHASNQWENLRRIQLESGTATTMAKVDLTPAKAAPRQRFPSEYYTSHPLVLGPGFSPRDLRLDAVNRLSYREAGVVVMGVNATMFANKINAARMLRTFRVKVEFGKSTDTGYKDGKVIERVSNPYLQRYQVERALSSIQSSHQKAAFVMNAELGHSLQTQAAYEAAVRGPIRPQRPLIGEDGEDLFVYGLRCVAYGHPDLEFEFNAFVESGNEVVQLVAELGRKLKAGAVVQQIRCIRYGHFDLSHALVERQVGLESVIENISALGHVLNDKGGLRRSKHLRKDDDDGQEKLTFGDFLSKEDLGR